MENPQQYWLEISFSLRPRLFVRRFLQEQEIETHTDFWGLSVICTPQQINQLRFEYEMRYPIEVFRVFDRNGDEVPKPIPA